MRSKKLLITLTIVAMTAVPFSVFAATSEAPVARTVRGFFGIDTAKLTDTQKADVKDYSQKMADLQKDFINKMVANGSLTKEQGDTQIKKIDDMLANGEGLMPDFGMGKGGSRGHEMRGGSGVNALDTSKLTDAQKADLIETYKKMADLQKELINKMVSDGLLTQQQADNSLKRVDEMLANLQQNGTGKGFGLMMGGFGFFGGKGFNAPNMTDQQKADLQDYSAKMDALQKELINKMVANGVLTQQQADAALNRMDNAPAASNGKAVQKGYGMDKGRGGKSGYGRQGIGSGNTTTGGTATVQ